MFCGDVVVSSIHYDGLFIIIMASGLDADPSGNPCHAGFPSTPWSVSGDELHRPQLRTGFPSGIDCQPQSISQGESFLLSIHIYTYM